MPYFGLTDSELRDVSKRHIETLEFWLRRVVDEMLSNTYGPRYWEKEPPVVKKDIRDKVSARIAQAPAGRFPRWIDATLIEHLIDFLFNEKLYKEHFKPYFAQLYPDNFASGREYLRFILEKCAVVRNALYHSNPISVRQAEQVGCYTNDVIDSIKEFYAQQNMHSDFNAPTFLSYSDSKGTKYYVDQSKSGHDILRLPDTYNLRCGDTIKMSIEVDASYNKDDYTIEWSQSGRKFGYGPEVLIDLDSKSVGERIYITVKVIARKDWHRHSLYDDKLMIALKVLPPL